MKRISVLLPYKENFSPKYAGAVSLLVKDLTLKSKYKNAITIYGSTDYKEKFRLNYENISFNKNFYESSNIKYAQAFLNDKKVQKSDLIEIHNRPATFNYIASKFPNINLSIYFHNDPLSLRGSITEKQRSDIFKSAKALIFISEWTKQQFFHNLKFKSNSKKVSVIYSSVNKKKLKKIKEKIILFVGKLNPSKGFDLFCNAVVKVLNKHKDWKAYVIGDEPRAKIFITHPRLIKLGFLSHDKVLNHYEKASIAVGCSKWDEPMGRVGLEASSRGCAVIVSNKGGLPETITNGIILNDLTTTNLYKAIDKLVQNKNYRKKLGQLSYLNFKNDLTKSAKKYDEIRDSIFNLNNNNNISIHKFKPLRVMHITNFAERHDGRLYFVSVAQKLSNGLIRNGHSVLNFSDRDMMRMGRNSFDIYGKKGLNEKLISAVKNYNPHLLLFGHADLINTSTLETLKHFDPDLKIAQWFEDPLIKNGPDFIKNKSKILNKIDFIDNSFITTCPKALQFDTYNHKFHFLPIPVDMSIERLKVFEKKNTLYDVFFAMSHGVNRGVLKEGKSDDREKFINKLMLLNPDIKFDVFGLNGRQPVWAEEFFQVISKSSMALNLSRGKPIKYYSSNRIASLLGNGLLTFIDHKTQLNNFFNDDEVIFYKNIYDLSESIQRYRKNDTERRKIAKNGWKKYHQLFNSTLIADYLINTIFEENSNKYKWLI